MKSSVVFKKQLLPKIVLIVFSLIAYEIIITFPFMSKELLGYWVNTWVHLILNIVIVAILLSITPSIKDFIFSMIYETMKQKLDKWGENKRYELKNMVFYLVLVIVIFISYSILTEDITTFLSGSVFDTIARIIFLILGLYFLYKSYIHFNNWLNDGNDSEEKNNDSKEVE